MELFDLMTSKAAGFLHDWWVYIALQTPPSREIVNEPGMARKDIKTGPMNTPRWLERAQTLSDSQKCPSQLV